MNRREVGFLLLTSYLGDPRRQALTVSQLRTLAQRAKYISRQERDMTAEDLVAVGYDRPMAERILQLLAQEDQLDWYIKKGAKEGCVPLSRISSRYPRQLKERLGWDCPGCLWAKGELELLNQPCVSLVGSRQLREENREFAIEVGRQAAKQGYALVSGNARGADKTAQDACLAAGGRVISIVADELRGKQEIPNVLYLSENSFDAPFSAQRALSRNRVIHGLGALTFVAQCDLGKGGTWDGAVKNLRLGLSPVFCLDDGSQAAAELAQMGSQLIRTEQLGSFVRLRPAAENFLYPQ